MTLTAAPPLAVEPKAITISQYEALRHDIEIAKQNAVESFDYEDPKGEKAARSYIAGLRKLRGRGESARKEAKSYALEYGRAVDGQAKALDAEILELIEPHQKALDEIAQREKDRVAGHEATLQEIAEAVQGASAEGVSAETIALSITWLENARNAEPSLEEFQAAADAEIANGLRLLNALHAAAQEREKREALEAAEAQRLAEEEQARRKAEEEARVQLQIREAEERARQEAEGRAARERVAAAQAQAEADLRARQAEERAQAAEAQRMEQERQARAQQEAAAQEQQRRAVAQATRRNDLATQLAEALASKTRAQVVEALLDGTLHPAVSIDWAKA